MVQQLQLGEVSQMLQRPFRKGALQDQPLQMSHARQGRQIFVTQRQTTQGQGLQVRQARTVSTGPRRFLRRPSGPGITSRV